MNLAPHLPLLLDLALKSIAILLLAGGLAWLLRGMSAARRHLVWLAAFVALALLPLMLAIPPRWSWSWQEPAVRSVGSAGSVHPNLQPQLVALTAGASPAKAASRLPAWPVFAGSVWLAGVLALLLRQALGFWKLRRLHAQSTPVMSGRVTTLAKEIGGRANVEMRASADCAVPLTWGLRRPVVMLPATAEAWPEPELRAALAHEFGHIDRRDFLWRQLAQIVRAIYWPSPLVWFALRALHRAQEEACDDLVLRRGARPEAYARQLFDAARALAAPHCAPFQAVAMAQPSTLEGRVRAIVDERRDRRAASPATRLAAGAGLVAVLAASAFAQVKTPPPGNASVQHILIEVKIIDAPDGAMGLSLAEGGDRMRQLTAEEYEAELRKLGGGVDVLTAPKVTTRAGQLATVEIGDADSGSTIRERIDVLPTIVADGLKLAIGFEHHQRARDAEPGANPARERISKRIFKRMNTVVVPDGKTVLIGGMAGEAGRSVVLAVTASKVDSPLPGGPSRSPRAGKWVPGKPGYVTSPFAPAAGFIDVRGFPAGTLVRDPYTQKIFLVPAAEDSPAPDAGKASAPSTLPLAAALLPGWLKSRPIIRSIRVDDSDADAGMMDKLDRKIRALVGQPYDDHVIDDNILKLYPSGVLSNVNISFKHVADGVEVVVAVWRKMPADARGSVSGQPVEINAKSVSYVDGVSVATGGAKFQHGKTTITGDSMRYDPKTRELEVTGSARAEHGGEVRTGAKIFYSARSGEIRIEGPAKTVPKTK